MTCWLTSLKVLTLNVVSVNTCTNWERNEKVFLCACNLVASKNAIVEVAILFWFVLFLFWFVLLLSLFFIFFFLFCFLFWFSLFCFCLTSVFLIFLFLFRFFCFCFDSSCFLFCFDLSSFFLFWFFLFWFSFCFWFCLVLFVLFCFLQTLREASVSALVADAQWSVSCPVAIYVHFLRDIRKL
jgi:hypothetical protein